VGRQRQTFITGDGTRFGNARPLMSDAVRWGDLLFLSGRAAIDPTTGAVRGDNFRAQARVVLDDVARVLEQAGSSVNDVLRVECWLAAAEYFAEWNELWAEFFPDPRPARTTVVGDFPVPGLLVELQVTAAISS
jgi:2-iminobutanoate/2-iminopropanoate deaminase